MVLKPAGLDKNQVNRTKLVPVPVARNRPERSLEPGNQNRPGPVWLLKPVFKTWICREVGSMEREGVTLRWTFDTAPQCWTAFLHTVYPFQDSQDYSEKQSCWAQWARVIWFNPELLSCILEFDGASKGNPGKAGAGAILRSINGTVISRLREGLGVTTSNVAEYRAIILGMKYALKKGFKQIYIQGDSKLVCNQEFNSDADAEAGIAVDLPSGEVYEVSELNPFDDVSGGRFMD
ncbi:hypothetical protein Taro_007912 [Colocasia esculenta]|uniref:RNase H type-1 domain-containing protein n=1 Tax=Colocasia esculenta TaxID=4460 RepID=A0A843U1V2_COLES|nr:hypothetical protein [Colocasia esculenta]